MNCSGISKRIQKINKSKGKPPLISSEDKYIQNDLGGKNFYELPVKTRELLYGDIWLLTPTAYKYYIFDFIEYIIKNNKLPKLFDMFLLSFSKESVEFDNRVDQLDEEEIDIIYNFLLCIKNYIDKSIDTDAIIIRESYANDIERIIDFWRRKNKRIN